VQNCCRGAVSGNGLILIDQVVHIAGTVAGSTVGGGLAIAKQVIIKDLGSGRSGLICRFGQPVEIIIAEAIIYLRATTEIILPGNIAVGIISIDKIHTVIVAIDGFMACRPAKIIIGRSKRNRRAWVLPCSNIRAEIIIIRKCLRSAGDGIHLSQ